MNDDLPMPAREPGPTRPTNHSPGVEAPRGATLPRANPFATEAVPAARALSPSTSEGGERNGVFAHLVTGDADITGLVAYSIYKQNKLDWLSAFEAAKGRTPTDDELTAYIIGEETPRRIATYRHLAEATLAGHGPDVGTPTGTLASRRTRGPAALAAPLVLTYVAIAILFVIGFWLAAHFTMASR